MTPARRPTRWGSSPNLETSPSIKGVIAAFYCTKPERITLTAEPGGWSIKNGEREIDGTWVRLIKGRYVLESRS